MSVSPFIGKYTNDLLAGNIVIPRKVNDIGEYLSHNLTHYHSNSTDLLHLHIDMNNETWHLELE